jgi:hypothetical protein
MSNGTKVAADFFLTPHQRRVAAAVENTHRRTGQEWLKVEDILEDFQEGEMTHGALAQNMLRLQMKFPCVVGETRRLRQDDEGSPKMRWQMWEKK